MRYWIRQDTMAYELSEDDLSRIGYIEVTERPAINPSMWQWSFETWDWELDKSAAKNVISQKRSEAEAVGVEFNGHLYATDDRSKLLLTMTAFQAARDDTKTYSWKTAAGEFVDITAAELLALVDGVTDYTEACFLHEKDLLVELESEDFLAGSIDEGWPSNIIV